MRFRDIHLFDERLASDYLTEPVTSNECSFYTLPVVDGYRWSSPERLAGLRLQAVVDGEDVLVTGGDPTITSVSPGTLHITWPMTSVSGALVIDIDETQIALTAEGTEPLNWFLDLTAADRADLPFGAVTPDRVECRFRSTPYAMTLDKGSFSRPGGGTILRVAPEENALVMRFVLADQAP